MRENRPYGSEGGEAKSLPYPYQRGWSFQGQNVITVIVRSEARKQSVSLLAALWIASLRSQ